MATPVNNPGMALQGGYLEKIPGGATLEQTQNVINKIVDALNNQLQQQIFSDGTSRRMIIGYQPGGWGVGKDFGIKISQAGVDVLAATDNQLLFKMDLQTWFFYDPSVPDNYMQLGILPDASNGWVVATPGNNVKDIYQ